MLQPLVQAHDLHPLRLIDTIAPARFAIYGDMRYSGHDAHRTVVEALVREAPALVINTGDLTDQGSQESNWQRYFDIRSPREER